MSETFLTEDIGAEKGETESEAPHFPESKAKARRVSVLQKDLPRIPLQDAIPIARAMYDNVASGTTTFDNIAKLLGSSPSTSKTKYMIWGAEAYGLIVKQENNEYSLSETGRKIVAPTYHNEDGEAKIKAILIPTVFSKFFTEYDKHPMPQETYLNNLLETKLGIPRERVNDAKTIILQNIEYAKIKRHDARTNKDIIDLSCSNEISAEESISHDSVVQEKKESLEENSINKPQDTECQSWDKTCFVICPIGDDDSEYRKHSDMIFKHLLKPVFDGINFSLVRADMIGKSGLITQQILEYLVKSRLCVADLSFSNPNVFYELGVRHLSQLPAIQIIRKGDKLPFDVSHGRTITIDTGDVYTLIDRIESAKKELSQYVNSITSNTSNDLSDDNPIKVYLPGIKVSIPK